MVHLPGYPIDIDSEPNRKEKSWEKQKSPVDMIVETKK